MGAYYKYIIPLSLVAICAVSFQNCGKTYQANGDPYENPDGESGIIVDLPIDNPAGGNGGGNNNAPPDQTASTFVPSLECTTSSPGLVSSVALGTRNGGDTAKVTMTDGRFKFYSGKPVGSVMTIGDQITSTISVKTLEFSGNQVRVNLGVSGSAVSEVLNCN